MQYTPEQRTKIFWSKVTDLFRSNEEKAEVLKLAAAAPNARGIHHIRRLVERGVRLSKPSSKPLKPEPHGRQELVAKQRKARPVYKVGMHYDS